MHVGHGADELVAMLGPEGKAAHDVVVERPILAAIEMSVDKASQRITVAERSGGFSFVAVLVAILKLDTVDVVFFKTLEGSIRKMVEVSFPLHPTIRLTANSQIKAILRQHFHIGVSFLKGKILAQATVNLKIGTIVIAEE